MNLSYARPYANTEDFINKTPIINETAAKEEEAAEGRDPNIKMSGDNKK